MNHSRFNADDLFHNPYHFVPVKKDVLTIADMMDDDWPESDALGDVSNEQELTHLNLGPASFDRFHKGTLSGSIVCVLETDGPVVIGGRQEREASDEPGKVYPFELENQPAIPGSTLRGCIVSIAEAASNSALRVLQKSEYSRRASMHDALSAMGMIMERSGDLMLKPLALPTLRYYFRKKAFIIENRFQKAFPEERYKVYCYQKSNLQKAPNSYSTNNKKYCYVKPGIFKYLPKKGKPKFKLGRECANSQIFWEKPSNEKGCVRGVMRVMHTHARHDEMSHRKHEIFLPFTEEMENDDSDLLDIPPSVLESFDRLARESSEDNPNRQKRNKEPLPFTLKGAKTLEARNFKLGDGDIVFFDLDKMGNISKLAISQIWREEITDENSQPATAHSFFKHIDPELLPFHAQRQRLTPAELLFGFVQNEPSLDREAQSQARALASRVRFGNARLIGKTGDKPYASDDWITLRILSSPKPPCPPFYFRKKKLESGANRRDCHIRKERLECSSDNSKGYDPQGRKFYLHHAMDEHTQHEKKKKESKANQRQKWETKDDEFAEQKNMVKPLAVGCQFIFKIDFENLTQAELGLLAYALRPQKDFQFKIGMGKPLGLGTVHIDVAGLMLVDRQKRYSATNFGGETDKGQRFSQIEFRKDYVEKLQEWHPSLRHHILQDNCVDDVSLSKYIDKYFEKTQNFSSLASIRSCIEKIGCTPVENVTYPVMKNKESEKELYEWFVANDKKGNGQGLVPLDLFHSQADYKMPSLKKYDK